MINKQERIAQLLTRREAMIEMDIASTTMTKFIGAGVIHPADTTLNGETHRFTRAEVERANSIPSGQIRIIIAMWEAKRKRMSRNGT